MALKGIKVIELAGLAPGPFCGMLLAEFGATVIRVDKVGSGTVFPDFTANGKRSIALNLKTKEGVEVFKKMSRHSDVIIDPFRRGVMEKMKIGPDDIMKINKQIIYARLTGFGQKGLYADMAGHDINFVGLSGLLSLFGRANEKPTPPINLASDFGGGGLMCALGIILALFERSRSNLGQVVDASMVEGTAYLGSWFFRSQQLPWLWSNPRGQNLLDTGTHFYNTYETKDKRYMAVGAIENKFYSNLLEKLGLSEDEVPQFSNFDKNHALFVDLFKKKTQAEWCAIFDGVDACVTPILNLKDTPYHPHNEENETFKVTKNNLVIPNPAPRLSRTPGISMATCKNPERGEHSIAILNELGYDSKEIDNFVNNGIVIQAKSNSKL
ncbi:PREDICTED: alpha-methylacyl-CoA racemase [Polistes dominula]|uniref:Alpha-methylacyl-CoA racemase n=1 Tax=Polistes dominula TaxID=743375 RepID=A0ABM1IVY6_POLDO|nr:PREDICTED: alpha-methylacyl-CoA racemase [Polistes dominula]